MQRCLSSVNSLPGAALPLLIQIRCCCHKQNNLHQKRQHAALFCHDVWSWNVTNDRILLVQHPSMMSALLILEIRAAWPFRSLQFSNLNLPINWKAAKNVLQRKLQNPALQIDEKNWEICDLKHHFLLSCLMEQTINFPDDLNSQHCPFCIALWMHFHRLSWTQEQGKKQLMMSEDQRATWKMHVIRTSSTSSVHCWHFITVVHLHHHHLHLHFPLMRCQSSGKKVGPEHLLQHCFSLSSCASAVC